MNRDKHYSISAMLHMLFGPDRDSVEAITQAKGKTITALSIEDNKLAFLFDDGTLKIYDDGQSCCEDRYMHTDDELDYYVGSKFLDVDVKSAPDIPTEDGEHEVQFLHVTTSKGVFVISNHNEHNGYYAGFVLVATYEPKEQKI